MKNNPVTIVSTKTLPIAAKTLLQSSKVHLIEEDFITIEFLTIDKLHLTDHIICTSKNAVKSLLAQFDYLDLKEKSFYCVGNKTQQLVEGFGGKIVVTCDYAQELAEVLCKEYCTNKFTFISGTIRHDVLPERLSQEGVAFIEHHVYRTQLTSHEISDQRSAVLFYSPSGVASFLQKNTLTNETCFCIGKTTAQSLLGKTNNIIIAPTPSVIRLVEACISHYA